MKKFTIVLLLVAFIIPLSLKAGEGESAKPETKKGDHALMFMLSGFPVFSLTGLNQTASDPLASSSESPYTIVGLGYKYFLGDMFALRFVPGLVMYTKTQKGGTGYSDAENKATGFDIHAGIEVHMKAKYSVSPYIGGLVGFTSLSTSKKPSVPTSQTANESTGSASVLSVGALCGFEWFVDDGISLGAEYNLGFSTSSSKTSIPKIGGGTTDYDGPTETTIGTGYFGLFFNVSI